MNIAAHSLHHIEQEANNYKIYRLPTVIHSLLENLPSHLLRTPTQQSSPSTMTLCASRCHPLPARHRCFWYTDRCVLGTVICITQRNQQTYLFIGPKNLIKYTYMHTYLFLVHLSPLPEFANYNLFRQFVLLTKRRT